MDLLTFISNLINSFAWPLTIIVAIFIFRKSLEKLILSLTSVKRKDLEIKFGQLEKGVEEIIDSQTEPDPNKMQLKKIDELNLNELDKKVIRAMYNGRYLYRGITGLENELSQIREEIGESLNKLESKNLVKTRWVKNKLNDNKQKRWYLSELGKVVLNLIETNK